MTGSDGGVSGPVAGPHGIVEDGIEHGDPLVGMGAVVLDIGGDIGALVVTLPEHLVGREIEIVPVGGDAVAGGSPPHAHATHEHSHRHDGVEHVHEHGEAHGHDSAHDDNHGHDHHGGFHASHHHPPGTPPHVGVVPRLMGGAPTPTAVFTDLSTGRYRLSVRPGEPPVDTVAEVDVVGGEVATLVWPV